MPTRDNRLQKLQEIAVAIERCPKVTPAETKRRFWRLARQIKGDRNPSNDEIVLAARIRNVLFRIDRGRALPLVPFLVLWFSAGTLWLIPGYLMLFQVPLEWSRFALWTQSDWWVFTRRLCYLMGAVFFYYRSL
jgi:hypothetical protein